MLLFIVALIVFIIVDVIIRYTLKHAQEKKIRLEREETLRVSLDIDFSKEAKSLKRVEVENPKAKILCVDDEEVILGSFRKILVLDGYSVDTVESGPEALNLIKSNHYDFCFTDLKMPEMSGVDVTKAVTQLRPDIDVVIITGYATVETAVECMQFGAMDYVEKPFTEDELLGFVKKCLFKRQDKIAKKLMPKVHITHLSVDEKISDGEFTIPGGVFIAENHCWVAVDTDGTAKIGIDDFSKKMLGKIEKIDLPNLGMEIEAGQPLFTVKQSGRTITFKSPLSGNVAKNNFDLLENLENLEFSPYDNNWFCTIDASSLDDELLKMKIGKSAVEFYHKEISKWQKATKDIIPSDNSESKNLIIGEMQNFTDKDWEMVSGEFFS
ncbi:MAG: response regulator [Bacteroidetes bacterium]|nr:response regulator [Bacteroidota bacterium]